MTFLPGQSGNPAGRPRGARNKKTLALEALLEGESEALMEKMIGLAKMGDDLAMRLCMERMLAPQRERPVPLRLPRIESEADAHRAAAEIIEALGEGEVTPREAERLLRALAGAAVITQSSDIAARLKRIEDAVAQRPVLPAPPQLAVIS